MIVKCYGQMDFCNELSFTSAIQQEREFFETHKHFSTLLDENKATIPHLANKLTDELVGRIIKTLPAIEKQVHDALQQASFLLWDPPLEPFSALLLLQYPHYMVPLPQ